MISEMFAGKNGELLHGHFLRGMLDENISLRSGHAQRLVPTKFLEYHGLYCRGDRVSTSGFELRTTVTSDHFHFINFERM